MKKVDFFIAYEVKRRDLEYLTLLKVELERRGYSVALDAANRLRSYQKPIYDAEVVICGGFSYEFVNFGNSVKFKKAVELKTEQIFNALGNRGVKERDEIGKDLLINVWGDKQKKRIVELEKAPEENVFVLGSVDMDFIKPRFDKFDYSKELIAKEFDLDMSKKWILFISSMTFKDSDSTIDEIDEKDVVGKFSTAYTMDEKIEWYKCEKQTSISLNKWFECVLKKCPDTEIIYRPHPVEMVSKRFLKLEQEYEGFKIIRDYSVRQWIKVCDRCYNWFSTSGIQAYFIGKPFYVLRPVPVAPKYEVECFVNSENYIDNVDDFIRTIYSDEIIGECSLVDSSIYDYYKFDINSYSYEMVSDLCEKVFLNDGYTIQQSHRDKLYYSTKKQWENYPFKQKVSVWGRRLWLYKIYHILLSPNVDYMNTNKRELRTLENRIKRCIDNGHENIR